MIPIGRALWFCKNCHDDVKDEKLIRKCKCKNRKSSGNGVEPFFHCLAFFHIFVVY